MLMECRLKVIDLTQSAGRLAITPLTASTVWKEMLTRRNFRLWLQADSPAMSPVRLLYPQQATFKAHVRFRVDFVGCTPSFGRGWDARRTSQPDPQRKSRLTKCGPLHQRLHFVTSMTAPVASGWSDGQVGLAPTGKAPPYHGAHPERTFHCPGALAEQVPILQSLAGAEFPTSAACPRRRRRVPRGRRHP